MQPYPGYQLGPRRPSHQQEVPLEPIQYYAGAATTNLGSGVTHSPPLPTAQRPAVFYSPYGDSKAALTGVIGGAPSGSPSKALRKGPAGREPHNSFARNSIKSTYSDEAFGKNDLGAKPNSSDIGGPDYGPGDDDDASLENELPLFEELGISPDRIRKRMMAALLFFRLNQDLLADTDMCGPMFVAGCLGACLLLAGKIHFGYIYGLSVTGCLCLYILLNLMSQEESIDLYRTTSILGYGLSPVVILAFISIFVSIRGWPGIASAALCVFWCTATASRFFETALQMHHQRFLVAYPVALLYACFVLITIF